MERYIQRFSLLLILLFCIALFPNGAFAIGVDPLEVTHATLHKDENKITLHFNRELDTTQSLVFNNIDHNSNFRVYNDKTGGVPLSDDSVSFWMTIDNIIYGSQSNTIDILIDDEGLHNMDTVTGDRFLTVILRQGAVKDIFGNEYHGHTVIVENDLPLHNIESKIIRAGESDLLVDDFIFFENDLDQSSLTGDIEITVTDSVYGNPVNEATVKILRFSNSSSYNVEVSEITGIDGKVILENIIIDDSLRVLNIENALNQPMLVIPADKAIINAEINAIYNAPQVSAINLEGKSNSVLSTSRLELHGQDKYIHYYIVDDDTEAIQFINRDESIPYGTRNIINIQEVSNDPNQISEIFFDIKDRSLYTIMIKDREPVDSDLRNITSVTIADAISPTNQKKFSVYNPYNRDLEFWLLNDLVYNEINVLFAGDTNISNGSFVYMNPETINRGEEYVLDFPSDDNLTEIYSSVINSDAWSGISLVYDYPTIRFIEDSNQLAETELTLYNKSVYNLTDDTTNNNPVISGIRYAFRFDNKWIYFRKNVSELILTPFVEDILGESLSLDVGKDTLTKGETQIFKFTNTDGYELYRIYDITSAQNISVTVDIGQGDSIIDSIQINPLQSSSWVVSSDLSTGTYTAEIVDAQGIPLDPDGKTVTFTVTPTVPSAPTIQSSVAGDAQVSITWDSVPEVTGYKIYQSNELGSYGDPRETVSSSVYSYSATGLTNGTTYYFTIKATNEGVDSEISNEVSSTPQVPIPGAPVLQAPIAGNEEVTLNWNSVSGSTGYKVYLSIVSNSYTTPEATVAGSVYNYNATGLSNDTTYYFVVKAENPAGSSEYSNEVSAIPQASVPEAPTNVTATAGNGRATVSFTPPSDNGGSPVTGYIVTSSPGSITATGTDATILVTGLANGTTYTFRVRAVNSAGNSQESLASNSVTPYRPSSGRDSDENNNQTTQPTNDEVNVLINGRPENAGTSTTTKEGNQTVTTITVDQQKLTQRLKSEGNNLVVTLPVNIQSDIVVGELTGDMIKSMEEKEAILEIRTDTSSYKLPTEEIKIDSIASQFGSNVELKDIKVQVKISKPTSDVIKIVEDSANEGNFTIIAPPLEFNVTYIYNDKTVSVSTFNSYVERTIAIPEGVNPDNITTGIVVDPDGTVRHVPTQIIVIDGRYYARINSLTNSVYSVIWNPKEFKDVEKHWAKNSINDMGGRMIISGMGNDMFQPDRDITRGEFAAVIVRGLGLKPGTGKSQFNDIETSDWYSGYIKTAYEYKIVSGYSEDKFGPMDKITREQAMTMVSRAMSITDLEVKFEAGEIEKILRGFEDSEKLEDYAKNSIAACIKAEIISGRNDSFIDSKANITRAETAVILRRLLQKSNLI